VSGVKHLSFGQVKYSAGVLQSSWLSTSISPAYCSYIWLLPDLPCMESTAVMGSRAVLPILLAKESLYIKIKY